MHNVDFVIVGVYLIVMFSIGLFMKGKAGQSITSYFIADRSLPGWWVGLSILATTFAASGTEKAIQIPSTFTHKVVWL